KSFCALGRDLATTGFLNQEGMGAVLKALRAYALICEGEQVEHVLTVGTAALREAKDAASFIATVQAETGLAIRVISGDAEARYAARGVLMQNPEAAGLVADFGGGSLEFAVLQQGHITDTISLPLGSYHVLALGSDSEGRDAPLENILRPLVAQFGHLEHFYAIGGAWRSLGAAYVLDNPDQNTGPIAAALMMEFCRKMEALPIDMLQQNYHLELPRATLIPIAAYTLRRVFEILQPQWFESSIAGVRDGLVHEFLSSHNLSMDDMS
ncbi:MAG: hypothetical protein AAB276_02530, partial [Pseudomonadota bacterium]